MSKKTLAVVFWVLSCTIAGSAQEIFTSKQWGLSMSLPKFWISMDKKARDSISDNYEFTEEALKKILDGDKGSTLVTAYYFNQPGRAMAVYPQVQIEARRKGRVDFAVFKAAIIKSSDSLKTVFPDITVRDAREVEVSGIKSVAMTAEFTIKDTNDRVKRARSRIYAVPLPNYFFQITLNDGQDPDADFSREFDALMNSMKIAKPL